MPDPERRQCGAGLRDMELNAGSLLALPLYVDIISLVVVFHDISVLKVEVRYSVSQDL